MRQTYVKEMENATTTELTAVLGGGGLAAEKLLDLGIRECAETRKQHWEPQTENIPSSPLRSGRWARLILSVRESTANTVTAKTYRPHVYARGIAPESLEK